MFDVLDFLVQAQRDRVNFRGLCRNALEDVFEQIWDWETDSPRDEVYERAGAWVPDTYQGLAELVAEYPLMLVLKVEDGPGTYETARDILWWQVQKDIREALGLALNLLDEKTGESHCPVCTNPAVMITESWKSREEDFVMKCTDEECGHKFFLFSEQDV